MGCILIGSTKGNKYAGKKFDWGGGCCKWIQFTHFSKCRYLQWRHTQVSGKLTELGVPNSSSSSSDELSSGPPWTSTACACQSCQVGSSRYGSREASSESELFAIFSTMIHCIILYYIGSRNFRHIFRLILITAANFCIITIRQYWFQNTRKYILYSLVTSSVMNNFQVKHPFFSLNIYHMMDQSFVTFK